MRQELLAVEKYSEISNVLRPTGLALRSKVNIKDLFILCYDYLLFKKIILFRK